MVLEPIKVDTKRVANVAKAQVVESTAGSGFGALIKGFLALAFVQALTHKHRKTVKGLRHYRKKRAKIFGSN